MNEPKREYQAPSLIEYGPIGDHTFATPGNENSGNLKGCGAGCELDSFLEQSHLPAS